MMSILPRRVLPPVTGLAPASAITTPPAPSHAKLAAALRGQPRTVWVTAFAAVIAFMGIGLVDPILLSIAEGLHATPSQTTVPDG